jgi:glutamate N-acetyltransferase / amino-acid N-acetyltransferase
MAKAALKRSPLAPSEHPALPPIAGARLTTGACGVRYRNRTDVALMEFAPGSTIAGVLTRSRTASAPVEQCRRHLKRGKVRAIIVNSGNANAFTGRRGRTAVREITAEVAKILGCRTNEVYGASTGVIGEPLPYNTITRALGTLARDLDPSGWNAAAAAIMTTDTFPKMATRKTEIGGVPVTINGIAKGSGMIAPDMATMLAFVATDAKISAAVLDITLRKSADRSFNAITVDGDTSTSDTLLLVATGQGAKHKPVRLASDPHFRSFRATLQGLLIDLACQVVKDGEGAGKFITIDVTGAASARAAKRIAFSIANSPLVKTAIAGGDANWGRIVMAVGKAGERADRDRMSIAIGGVTIAARGEAVAAYDEAPVARHMAGTEIHIAVDVGIGRGAARVWTCDLTHGYIDINADYRS